MPAVCHITHIHNLPGILREQGLWCDRKAEERGLIQTGIAHDHIKRRRKRRAITVGPGGFLCDYVPFYFWYHSPMLYAIHSGTVLGDVGSQKTIIYLVSSVKRVQARGLPFAFTDGHADYTCTSQMVLLGQPVRA